MIKFKPAPDIKCDDCAQPLYEAPWVEWSFSGGGIPFDLSLCQHCALRVSQHINNNAQNIRRIKESAAGVLTANTAPSSPGG